jgi:hypothetical protein
MRAGRLVLGASSSASTPGSARNRLSHKRTVSRVTPNSRAMAERDLSSKITPNTIRARKTSLAAVFRPRAMERSSATIGLRSTQPVALGASSLGGAGGGARRVVPQVTTRQSSAASSMKQDHPSGGRAPPDEGLWNTTTSANGSLRTCLADIIKWSSENQDHEVVTVFLDSKDGWTKDHGPAELDKVLSSSLGSRLFSPKDLQAGGPSVRAATWPSLKDLRGRVIAVITGGGPFPFSANNALSYYVNSRGDAARAFVAPYVQGEADFTSAPTGFDRALLDRIAYVNVDFQYREALRSPARAGMVARVWSVPETTLAWDELRALRANLIALDDPSAARVEGKCP